MAQCACDVKLDGALIGKVTVGTYAYAESGSLSLPLISHDALAGVA
jgi:hypothetical protein